MNFEEVIKKQLSLALKSLYNFEGEVAHNIQKTKKEFVGDTTVVVFPYVKISAKGPEQTAEQIGNYLKEHCDIVDSFNVVKGFLNISLTTKFWLDYFNTNKSEIIITNTHPQTILVEYSSPNTNKPLHLGHVRNNLLGFSVAEILKAAGNKVLKVNIVNDRGIHICKSMIAWEKYGAGETPETNGLKGDHLVGKYYVEFDKHYKKQISELIEQGATKEDAEKKAPLILEAQEMLRKWESGDDQVIELWKKMNSWVYEGFDVTYKKLGVDFDKIYYESQTYILGKSIVEEGLKKGVFFKKEDGSVRIDLTQDGLDEKVLLRSDGTSVYITQDLGTAQVRAEEFNVDKMVYVVGNEQEYHFKVLKKILQKLEYPWADGIFHLSYGMVELPEGKMKSREGTVVDADDLIDEMVNAAGEITKELGKTEGLSDAQANELFNMIGMGALKYFILKVDPKKKMLFNPAESIDFNGNTGPFIQYTHARICSVMRKASDSNWKTGNSSVEPNEKERSLIKLLYEYPATVLEAANGYSPALIANYVYELAKEYNQFYHDYSILKEENEAIKLFRLQLSQKVAGVIKHSMLLLGISVPERM